MGHTFIGTEHLLLGLIDEGEGVAAKALELLGVRLDDVRAQVEDKIGKPGQASPTGSPPFTPRAKKVMELSLRESLQMGHGDIGTEHILLGIVREGEGVGAQVLVSLGADITRVRQQVMQLVSGSPVPASRLKTSRTGGAPRPLLGPASSMQVNTVGKSWTARVVRPGRGPSDYAMAYEELVELAQLDVHEQAGITITSVDTPQGPGIALSFTRHVHEADVEDDGDDETP
jgi:ATP-dependent Clp protease ATP-binding subunit ClpA